MKEDKLENTANYSDSDSNDSNSSFNDCLKDYKEDLKRYLSNTDKSEKSNDLANDKTDFKMDKESNVSYKLFTIGPTESLQHERIKSVKEYQMLVRTKTDSIEVKCSHTVSY